MQSISKDIVVGEITVVAKVRLTVAKIAQDDVAESSDGVIDQAECQRKQS